MVDFCAAVPFLRGMTQGSWFSLGLGLVTVFLDFRMRWLGDVVAGRHTTCP